MGELTSRMVVLTVSGAFNEPFIRNIIKRKNNLYIVKRILSELNKSESLIEHVADRHGHDQRYAIDPHKANAELGWDPITTFELGIKKTIG